MNLFFKLTFVFLGVLSAFPVLAEVKCSQLVSYVLDKESQNTEVYFSELRAMAVDEAQAKLKIDSEAVKSKTNAMQQCRKLHENVSGCLLSKLETAAETLQAASFSARKALEDSLIADCKKQQGNCKEVKLSEMKCEQLAAAPVVDEKAAKDKPADAEKDKKAKK